MSRTQSFRSIALACLLAVLGWGAGAQAQYSGVRIDNGQQYWNNYRQQQAMRKPAMPPQSRAATLGNTGGYYSTLPAQPAQKPFADVRPAPNAFHSYWPLMVYPNNGLGYWY